MGNKVKRVRSVKGLSKEEELNVLNQSFLPVCELLDQLILPQFLGSDAKSKSGKYKVVKIRR